MRFKLTALLFFFGVSSLGAMSQAPSWGDAAFEKKFLGSYGFDGAREPVLVPAQRKIFEEVLPLMRSGALKEAAAKIKNAETSGPLLDYLLGNIQFQLGDGKAAEISYKKAIEAFPNFLRAIENMGFLMLQHQQFAKAEKFLQKAIQLGAKDALSYEGLAWCYFKQQEYTQALRAYDQALLLAPDRLNARLARAEILAHLKQFKRARTEAEAILKHHSKQHRVRLFLAQVNFAERRYKQAALQLEWLRRHRLHASEALPTLAKVYLMMDLPHLALGVYRTQLDAKTPLNFEDWNAAAGVLTARDLGLELVKLLDRILAESLPEPQRERFDRLKGKILLQAGRVDDAREHLQLHLRNYPLDAEGILLLGQVYLQSGQEAAALVQFERAEHFKGFAAEAKLQQARVRARWKQHAKAATLLREAQSIEPRKDVAEFLEAVERARKILNP